MLGAIRTLCRDRLRLATTVGYGPRCLYVAGQLHQGGAGNGMFLQLCASVTADLPVPDEPFTFGVLRDAQGLGDLEALQARGRRVLRVDLRPQSRRRAGHAAADLGCPRPVAPSTAMVPIIDSHCHVDFDHFAEDVPAVLDGPARLA